MTTTITPSNRDQYLLDIFTTALEGGINYWAAVDQYRWSVEHDGHTPDYREFHARIRDAEGDDVAYAVNRKVIAKGYQLAATEWRSKLCWSTEPPPLVITDDTDWDYDAGDADMIVQLGLFGNVIYG
jgi:hypothetical protein